MSLSTFLSSSVASFPTKSNWFSGKSNRSGAETAQVVTTGYEDGRMKDILSMLNSIGTLYSVPYLLFQKGYDCNEIADQLNVPVGTVKSRLFTARVKMKHLIAERKAAQ